MFFSFRKERALEYSFLHTKFKAASDDYNTEINLFKKHKPCIDVLLNKW